MDWYEKGMGERFSTFHAVLLAIWLAVLVWSGINPHDRLTWWLACTPGLIGFALLALTWGKFRFSRFCYALIAIHCVILFIGAKYTYAEVPLFTWLEGPLHFARNNYDKVGHFAQGAFPAIIAREIILRTRAARSKAWAAFFSITVCLSIAALYEIFEWATAEIIHEEADAFLGTQGDPWDTQKDMAWCLVGAVFSMLFLTGIHDRSIRRLVSRRNE